MRKKGEDEEEDSSSHEEEYHPPVKRRQARRSRDVPPAAQSRPRASAAPHNQPQPAHASASQAQLQEQQALAYLRLPAGGQLPVQAPPSQPEPPMTAPAHAGRRTKGKKRTRVQARHQEEQQEEDEPEPEAPPADPLDQALILLRHVAPVSDERAREVLALVLEGNQELKQDVHMWVDEAQVILACNQEMDSEANQMKLAMECSLEDTEGETNRRKEEEAREGRVAAVKRKFGDSSILAELYKVACPALLLTSCVYAPLAKLLTLEKRSKQWYDGRGTLLFYERLGREAAANFRTSACLAMEPPLAHPAEAAPQQQQQLPAAQGLASQLLRPRPLICCHQPPANCGLCGMLAALEAGAAAVPSNDDDEERAVHPQLAMCFSGLAKVLKDKEAYIQVEIARMPSGEDPMASSGSGRSTATCQPGSGSANGSAPGAAQKVATYDHVPLVFRMPEGEDAREEINCISSDED